MEYGALPPEINSARAYAGPQSTPLNAAAAAWQALAANLASSATALNAAIMALLGGGFQGPSSVMMAGGAAESLRWLTQSAAQAEQMALAATQAGRAVDAAYAGVVPPPLIEANRTLLETLIATNFMGVNSPAIAATIAEYDEMWTRDATVMYGFSADAAAVTASLIPFTPPMPTVNAGGVAGQAAAVAQASGTAAGQVGQNAAAAGQTVSSMGGGGASDAASIMTMAPQFLSSVPQALQGLASPLMGGMGNPLQSLGGFQSLLTPFLGMMSNPMMGGIGGAGAATSAAAALSGAGGMGGGGFGAGGAGALSAGLGRGGSLGGLSVPATWAANAQSAGGSAGPVSASSGGASGAAAPHAAGAAGGTGAAPMAAMGGRDNSSGSGQSFGAPVRVLPRPR